jgi:hypothetical protein
LSVAGHLLGYRIDAADAARIARLFDRLSANMQQRAWERARSTIRRRLKVETVRLVAKRTDLRPKDVRDKIRDYNDGSAYGIDVRSRWLPLYELGAVRRYGRKRPRNADGTYAAGGAGGGVTVRGWGRHRGAFVATMKSGHVGIFRRVGEDRAPVREVWGPNPAWEVFKNDQTYLAMMQRIVQEEFVPELERQIKVLLGG